MPEIDDILSNKEIDKIIKFNEGLQDTDKTLDRLLETVQKFNDLLKSNVATIESVKKAQTENNTAAKKLDATTRELIKLDKQMETAEIKVTAAYKQVQKATIAKTEAAKASTKATRQEVLANSALKGSYNAISLSLSKNIAKFKALSETERETSKRGKELTATIQRQDAELKKLDKTIGRSQRGVGSYTDSIKQSAKSLLGAFGLVGGVAAFAKVLTSSFKTVVKFEKAQSELAAILRTNTDEIKDLTAASLEFGRVTKFTASEVSGLQKELAKLGFTQPEILASTKAILDLAAATESDLSLAAKVAGSALRAFGLDASEAGRVASVLAVATTKSALTFQDFESSLSNVAPVAKAFGFSIEETVALLGNLRDAGFEANKASVATRNILLNLADSGGTLAKALGGSVRSFDELIPALIELRNKGISLNETLDLTDKRSVAAFNRFLEGAESAEKLRDGLIDVQDELQGIVDTQLDNMAGDVTLLASAWDGLVLSLGDIGFFRKVVQGLTSVVKDFTRIDEEATKIKNTFDKLISGDVINTVKKTSEGFQELINTLDLFDADELGLADVERIALEGLKGIGFSLKQSVDLWDEYVRRREEQTAIEEAAVLAAETAKQNAAEKTRIEKESATEKANAKTAKENKRASDKFLKENAEFADDELKAAADLDTLAFEQQVKEDAKSLDQTIKFLEEKSKEEKKAADESIKLAEGEAEKKKELDRQNFDAKLELAQVGADALSSLIGGGIERERVALEEERDRRLLAAGDDADKRAKIESDFEKKSNELKVKAAKANKLQSLFDIAINTAVAVTKALAQTGVLAPFVIPGIIAAGVIQAAVVLAQPIPKFYKGKKGTPDTFIAGDSPTGMAARELVVTKSGESYMAEKDTLFSGNKFKGATVHNNKETEAIMRGGEQVNNINFDTVALQRQGVKNTNKIVRAIRMDKQQRNRAISQSYKNQYLN
jgi:TP901 family phage tail tape measure protein